MREGGETFNERVMSDGLFPACAYAITERRKAEDMASAPLRNQSAPDDDFDSFENIEYMVSFKACLSG